MNNLQTLTGVNGRGNSNSVNVTLSTFNAVQEFVRKGYKIIINCNWRYKAKGYQECVKIVQTNSRRNGYPQHIVWAVK